MESKKTKSSPPLSIEREKTLRMIAKDTVVSFKLEGIVLDIEEAYQMVLEADSKSQVDRAATVS